MTQFNVNQGLSIYRHGAPPANRSLQASASLNKHLLITNNSEARHARQTMFARDQTQPKSIANVLMTPQPRPKDLFSAFLDPGRDRRQ